MKQYPTIVKFNDEDTNSNLFEMEFWAFDKVDGSNIRVEWNSKKSFYKFGSRTQLLDPNNPILSKAIPLILKYEENLSKKFLELKYEQVMCYFEFFGANSFAGQHDPYDLNFDVVLLDIEVHKKGYVDPENYIKHFSNLVPTPAMLFQGLLTETIIAEIKQGTFPGMSFEGVVFKAPTRGHHNIMFKIKNQAWIEKVCAKYGDMAEKFI